MQIGCRSCDDASVPIMTYIKDWGLYEGDCEAKANFENWGSVPDVPCTTLGQIYLYSGYEVD